MQFAYPPLERAGGGVKKKMPQQFVEAFAKVLIFLFREIKSFHKLSGEITSSKVRIFHQLQVERNGSFNTFNYKFA